MTRNSQKATERFWAERLLDVASLGFEIDEVAPQEFPDLMLHMQGRSVGLEVTEIHFATRPGESGGSARRALEGLKEKLLRAARDSYLDSGAEPIAVQALFHPARALSLSASEVDRVAKRLAGFLIANPPSGLDRERHNLYESAGLAPPLSTVFVRKPHPGETPRWQVVGAHTVRALRTDDVTASIAVKNQRLASYRTPGQECWLLLAANRMSSASAFQPTDPALLDLSSSKFTRTCVLLYPDALYEHELGNDGPPNMALLSERPVSDRQAPSS